MENRKDIDLKIARCLQGEASEDEKREVDSWAKQSEQNEYEYERLRAYWKKPIRDPQLVNHEEQKAQIWQSFLEQQEDIPQRKTSRGWLRMVAAFLLLACGSFLFYQSDYIFQKADPDSPLWITKANQKGQKSQIQLPDGSKVWLNADSKISYQEVFSDTARVIQLGGEAFFDVVRDSLRPFIVTTEGLNVRVLGTQFNVEAFEGERDITVSLLEGAVEVHSSEEDSNEGISIQPENGISFIKQENIFQRFSKSSHKEKFNKAISWKEGVLIFEGVDMSVFIQEISRWYGVSVVVKGTPTDDWDLKGQFNNEYLSNILEAVSYSKGFEYEIEDKLVTLTFDNNQKR
ncbi:hypothetical protein DN752_23040 [Echinicola strongylocentroti]|uniref:FecR family protein n=1 Tax=Echinicola strongylocentroti TaxID=1795355 RepID=A0A2Z4IPP4_9BACT|nr:FecR family protein [Echinicola strongylocentroti]AWW32787.1 hypothetical protein DN752_23040 [Echinicola strongylocentroti]